MLFHNIDAQACPLDVNRQPPCCRSDTASLLRLAYTPGCLPRSAALRCQQTKAWRHLAAAAACCCLAPCTNCSSSDHPLSRSLARHSAPHRSERGPQVECTRCVWLRGRPRTQNRADPFCVPSFHPSQGHFVLIAALLHSAACSFRLRRQAQWKVLQRDRAHHPFASFAARPSSAAAACW